MGDGVFNPCGTRMTNTASAIRQATPEARGLLTFLIPENNCAYGKRRKQPGSTWHASSILILMRVPISRRKIEQWPRPAGNHYSQGWLTWLLPWIGERQRLRSCFGGAARIFPNVLSN